MDTVNDVFFKKKIITIYLHPGARKRKRRWAGLVLFTRDTGGEGGLKVEAWGEGKGPRSGRFSCPQPCPSFLLFPPHNQLKSS